MMHRQPSVTSPNPPSRKRAPRKDILAGWVLLLSASPAMAGTQHFETALDAVQWQATSEKLHCSLTHDIALYGRATFEQSAGHALNFHLAVKQSAIREQERAQLSSLPPGWHKDKDGMDLGDVDIHPGKTPFQLNEALARRLLAELQKGMFPTFSYRDWADAEDRISVALPGVNIRQALDEFITCLSDLPTYNFLDYRDTVVHFAFGNDELSSKARKRLAAVATYLRTDPEVKKIIIEGHTDDVGQYRDNDKLGQRRSLAIRHYLLNEKVPADLFELKSFGERKPIYTNTTDEGRARNRRAYVTLKHASNPYDAGKIGKEHHDH